MSNVLKALSNRSGTVLDIGKLDIVHLFKTCRFVVTFEFKFFMKLKYIVITKLLYLLPFCQLFFMKAWNFASR